MYKVGDTHTVPWVASLANNVIIETIRNTCEHLEYAFFSEGVFNLMLFGIRNQIVNSNTYNDRIGVIYRDQYDVLTVEVFPGTTDPGRFFLKNPLVVDGTAILPPGQYRGMFKIGTHKGYEALVQNIPLKVWRDHNRDAVLDIPVKDVRSDASGIDLHRGPIYNPGLEPQIGSWSAGCQVLQYYFHFMHLMSLANVSKGLYGNSFTYTLFDEAQLVDEGMRKYTKSLYRKIFDRIAHKVLRPPGVKSTYLQYCADYAEDIVENLMMAGISTIPGEETVNGDPIVITMNNI